MRLVRQRGYLQSEEGGNISKARSLCALCPIPVWGGKQSLVWGPWGLGMKGTVCGSFQWWTIEDSGWELLSSISWPQIQGGSANDHWEQVYSDWSRMGQRPCLWVEQAALSICAVNQCRYLQGFEGLRCPFTSFMCQKHWRVIRQGARAGQAKKGSWPGFLPVSHSSNAWPWKTSSIWCLHGVGK